MVESKNHIKLDSCTIFFREDGIVEVVFKDQIMLEQSDCVEINDVYLAHLGDKKAPILHIISKYMNVTKEAREYSASEEGLKSSIAEAFVFDSLPHRIVANFYIRVNSPGVPTKFFKTKKEAEVWLKTFL